MTSETSDIASGCWSILAVGVYAACLNYRIVWSIYGINAWTLFYNILLSCYEFWGSEFAYIYVFISLGSFICSALTGVTLLQDFRYRAAGRLIKMNLVSFGREDRRMRRAKRVAGVYAALHSFAPSEERSDEELRTPQAEERSDVQ